MKNKPLIISIIISVLLISSAFIFVFYEKEDNKHNPITQLLEHLNKKESIIPEWEEFVVEDTPNSKVIIRESNYLKYLETIHEEEQLKKRRENVKIKSEINNFYTEIKKIHELDSLKYNKLLNEAKELKDQSDKSKKQKELIEIREKLESFLSLKTEFITPIKENSAIFIIKNDPYRNKTDKWESASYIKSINPLSEKYEQIIISGQYTPSIEFYKNKVFYVNTSGEIANIDITNGKEEIIKTPEISFPTNYSNSISSLFISNDILFYSKGFCAEYIYCDFGMYDLISEEKNILIKDVLKTFNIKHPGGAGIYKYDHDKNIAYFRSGYGDGGGPGRFKKHEINLETLSVKDIGSVTYSSNCDEIKDDFPDCISTEEAFEKKDATCNGIDFSQYENNDMTYLGCVESI